VDHECSSEVHSAVQAEECICQVLCRDHRHSYEPGVLVLQVQNCLLRVGLEILVNCSVFITVWIVLPAVSINTVIC